MATSEKFSQSKKKESEMDLSLAETSCVSVRDKLVDSVISISSVTPLHDKTAACDSALRSVIEENAFQALSDEPWAKRPRLNLSEDSSAKANDFSFLTFPKKLWKIVESDQFKSIWWDDDGNCVVIDEEFFKKEVLERRGPLRIFETDCMKSFIRQLNLYGFSKMRQDFQRSASLAEFLAEEKAASAFSKLQFYYNPNFKRGYPHLLIRCKRRVGIKNKPPVALSLNQDFNESRLRSKGRSPDVQSALGPTSAEENNLFTAAPKENTQISAPRSSTITKGLAKATTRIKRGYTSPHTTSLSLSDPAVAEDRDELNQLAAFHLPQHSSHAQVGIQDTDTTTTTSSTSLYHVIPPVPNSPFRPVMGLPAFPSMYPDLSAMQAHWASLLPFCNPWFSMPMIAAASAISMSRSSHHQSPTYHHCPNCNCTSNSAPAGKGAGPKTTEYTGYHR
ncbi:heat shock transcription factor, Y-linked-like [Dromaius novaehollandiae]|uniref:Heat shock transcription factor, Y-linked-like n=2 Tax=Dromaius novaehollandiae TaxID=8790 RepID=A0A8C4JBZ7_DRONO|nr:heat shock transcription factor, Y-linked-like [Dromaius novaehollandiae]XP_025962122.1 heat shock transcription factor, Y-linked-like [Dromaius novaehollandiae]